jgi:hypothetical protein
LLQSGSASFDTPREGLTSPLAKRLFGIDGITGVFFGSDFLTVTKSDDYAWSILKPEIFAAIMEHFTSGMLLQHLWRTVTPRFLSAVRNPMP